MITERMLDELRESIEKQMSPKRFRHTAEVEKMAIRLGEIYAPELITELRAAALLHDLTKEYPTALQLEICKELRIELDRDAIYAPKTLHARTAAAMIPERYSDFAAETVVSAVRWHTTGRADMSLPEKLIYLADYIDMSRSFPDCVRLRGYFWSAEPEKMNTEDKDRHLRRTLIMSFNMTVRGLLDEGLPISRDSIEARNALVCEELRERAER